VKGLEGNGPSNFVECLRKTTQNLRIAKTCTSGIRVKVLKNMLICSAIGCDKVMLIESK
jgi:hypothetical protein